MELTITEATAKKEASPLDFSLITLKFKDNNLNLTYLNSQQDLLNCYLSRASTIFGWVWIILSIFNNWEEYQKLSATLIASLVDQNKKDVITQCLDGVFLNDVFCRISYMLAILFYAAARCCTTEYRKQKKIRMFKLHFVLSFLFLGIIPSLAWTLPGSAYKCDYQFQSSCEQEFCAGTTFVELSQSVLSSNETSFNPSVL